MSCAGVWRGVFRYVCCTSVGEVMEELGDEGRKEGRKEEGGMRVCFGPEQG